MIYLLCKKKKDKIKYHKKDILGIILSRKMKIPAHQVTALKNFLAEIPACESLFISQRSSYHRFDELLSVRLLI